MSIINIIGGRKPSLEPAVAFVYTKKRDIIPFIGVRMFSDGSCERVVGVKCPDTQKRVFQSVDSDDPLVYLRVWKMLGYLKVITDELVQASIQDCIIATQQGSRLWNFSQTSVYRDCGIYKRSMFEDAQKKALAFKPGDDLIQKLVKGFAEHGTPLATEKLFEPAIDNTAPSCTVIHLTKSEAEAPPHGPAKRGFFYKPLVLPLGGPSVTQTS